MLNPVKWFGELSFRKSLEETGPVRTFARLCTSRHLEDLQWIAFFVILTWVIGMLWLLDEGGRVVGFAAISFGGLTGAAATALTWAYQTGCNRIGAVDLFGCEISAICRVCLVVDFARSSLGLPEAAARECSAPAPAVKASTRAPADFQSEMRFTSEEHYTPVYDSNLADLQPLDATVVTNVTEFYTYRKTMMDILRKLGSPGFTAKTRRQTATQMIYMQFLMYESGRKAIAELIEFEPNRAESLINIYCSEVVLYQFLVREYSTDHYAKASGAADFRLARLRLRESHYLTEVPALLHKTLEQRDHPEIWDRAQATAAELLERFFEVFPNSPSVLGNPIPKNP